MSGYLLKFKQTYSVKIGGRRYPVVKIGNQLWMAENLDWKWTNLTVGGSYVNDSNPHAWYYNNDESTYGVNGNKYGLLYNTAAMEELVNGQIELPANWRVPTYNDFNILYTLVGSNNAAKLKSVDGWISGNGTDDYGFNGKPTGAIIVTASPYSPAGVGEYANFYSQTEYSSTRQYGMWLYYNSSVIDIPGAYTTKGNAISIRLVSFDYGKVTIGGRDYKTVKIGNQEWLAENLDYAWSGLTVGGSGNPTTPAAWYYNNNETDYGIDGTYKCGLLYNGYAAKYLNDNKATLLPEGWHIPTSDEWTTLANSVGSSTAGTKLKALDGSAGNNWPSGWNGTDDYGFKALPAGSRHDEMFASLGSYANFWSSTVRDSSSSYGVYFDSYSVMNSGYYGYPNAISVRLVKSLT